MNKSILIVICDFLLVSLLAFSTIDINRQVADGGSPQFANQPSVTNQVDTGKDLAAVIELLALSEERKKQEQLHEWTLAAAGKQNAGNNEQQSQKLRQALQAKEQEATLLEQQRTGLQQQYISAQTNIEALNRQAENRAT